jgi:putative oxidoreductase
MSYDLGVLIVRLLVGLLLAGHGAQKLFGWYGGAGLTAFTGMVERMGFRPGRLWAALAAVSEFGGGLALALGLLMPLPTVGIVAAMGIVVFKVHWKNGLWASKGGVEYPLTLMVVAATLGLVGPGRYSLDALLRLHLPAVPVFFAGVALALIVIGVGIVASRRPSQPEDAGQRVA